MVRFGIVADAAAVVAVIVVTVAARIIYIRTFRSHGKQVKFVVDRHTLLRCMKKLF